VFETTFVVTLISDATFAHLLATDEPIWVTDGTVIIDKGSPNESEKGHVPMPFFSTEIPHILP
jgi:hypothetical protein